jgi:Zn/Cd-binding protein ZinT
VDVNLLALLNPSPSRIIFILPRKERHPHIYKETRHRVIFLLQLRNTPAYPPRKLQIKHFIGETQINSSK